MTPGTKMHLGSQEYTLAPLTIYQLVDEGMEETAQRVSEGGKTSYLALAEVVHASLGRNHPELTLDQVKKILDRGNMREAFAAAMALSGLRPAEPGEAAAAPGPTGDHSTASSAPPAALPAAKSAS